MKREEPPIRQMFDLSDLSQAGTDVAIEAQGDELARLAEWAGVDAVRAFGARVNIRKLNQTRFAYEADLTADIVQSCIVTLEPVETGISRHIERELHITPRVEQEGGILTLAAGDDDVPETIDSTDYDLAGPLLEEFALAIDPYPRKAGVSFTPPAEADAPPESPFAVLKALKDRG